MLVLMRAFGDGKRGFEAEIVSGNCLSKLYFDEYLIEYLLFFKISIFYQFFSVIKKKEIQI